MAIIIKEMPDLSKARSRLHQSVTIVHDEIAVPERLKAMALGKTYFIRTYGCQANVRDEETMRGLLEEAGFSSVDKEQDADLIILNTCAVRENAEDKVFGEIGVLKGIKSTKKDIVIAIGGCMVQQAHIVATIIDKHRHVDLMFGTHNIHQLLDMLDEVYVSRNRLIDVPSIPVSSNETMPAKRLHRYKAFVNIMYGCDKFCTYCIVPYTRGRERSRPKEDILAECRQLVATGYQEITLLGQNVNAYGKDQHDGYDFASLLKDVALTGIPRLRFTTSHPWDFSASMIEVISAYPNIMKAIHLPVQSGNSAMLRLMGRRYTRESYVALVEQMRAKMPDIALTTDIIVGFPNETDAQFNDTLTLVEQVGYDGCFTFIYSPRQGTPASRMKDDVLTSVKHERFDRLLIAVEASARHHADALVGTTQLVLVDGYSKRNKRVLSGYTEGNKLVHFSGSSALIGAIVKVKIVESHLYSFKGELIND
ncbi:MAG TPA: tRNA (N6-isopentenyl adenosine(37)-C2)-methylthiotransferase MiaB [Firmicutes bacterium]|nr:tRNA (N6-isopentenyl adenosine(37)-C2)-methylthiotransferase MiaB [Bacillota bacterium]